MEYIIGIAVSLLVAYLKKWFGTNEYKTLLVLLLVSIAAAAVFVLFGNSAMWSTVVKILEVAGAFYAFVLLRFQSSK